MKAARLISLTGVLLALAAGRAGAAEGPYVGLDAGVSQPTNDNYRAEVETGGTGAPFAGVMLGDYFGIQAQFHSFFQPGNNNDNRSQPNLSHPNQWTTILGLAAGPRLVLPLTERLRIYGLGEGGGFKGLGGRLNQWAPGFSVGGGIDFNITPTVVVGLFGRWNRLYMAPHPTELVGHAANDQGPEDARFATGGISVTYFYGPQAEVVALPAPPPPPPPAVAAPPSAAGEAPAVAAASPPLRQKIVLRSVHFDFDKADIRADARPVLDEAVRILEEQDGKAVIVAGYTDSRGGDMYNMRLSLKRAEAVYAYLVDHGIASDRIRTEAFGKARAVASNDTADGRAQNRRVELDLN